MVPLAYGTGWAPGPRRAPGGDRERARASFAWPAWPGPRSAGDADSAIGVVALAVAAVASPIGVRAAEPTFGTPTASATYGTGVTFEQPFTPASDLRRVELLWSSPGALGNVAVEVPTPPCCQPTTLSSTLAEKDSHLVPNTPVHRSLAGHRHAMAR